MRLRHTATVSPLAPSRKRPCNEVPAISSLSEPPADGSPNTITGSGFLALRGTGKVEVGDASSYEFCGTVVEQTINSWSDVMIGITMVQGALPSLVYVYLYVTNDCGNRNGAGYSFIFPGPP